MNRRWIVTLVVVVLLLTAVSPVWAAGVAQDEGEVELEGTLETIDLEAGFVVVDGTTFLLDEETAFLRGRGWRSYITADDLEVGMWVEAAGVEQADGSILLHHIRVKDGLEDDEDDEEEGAPPGLHPAAVKISQFFEVDYEEIMAFHEEGFGFGEIIKAYSLAQEQPEGGLTAADFLAMRQDGMGWGVIWKEMGVHPGQGGPPPWAGQGRGNKGQGPPD